MNPTAKFNPYCLTLESARERSAAQALGNSVWRALNNDPWFLWEGDFPGGEYRIRFEGGIAHDSPETPLNLYYAEKSEAFSEQRVFRWHPLAAAEMEMRTLVFTLPKNIGRLRLDPAQAAVDFTLKNLRIERVQGADCRDGLVQEEPPLPAGEVYDEDGLTSAHNCDFLREPAFIKAYERGKGTASWGASEIRWRAHTLCWAARQACAVAGDFVECGVNAGGTALMVIDYVNFQQLNRKFYLLDTFSGIPAAQVTPFERRNGILDYHYADCYGAVQRTFSQFKNVVLVKGTVPESLSAVKSEQIAYLHLDMNCAAPEIAAAEYFWERLSAGAAVVLDDYGWSRHQAQKRAFDRFAAERGIQVLTMPTGQGLLVKPVG